MWAYEEKPWLQHYPKEIPLQLDYKNQPLQEFLTDTAMKAPHEKAVHFQGKEMTFKEIYDAAIAFANFLISKGLKKGDRVALYLANSPQAIISYYGTLYAGGIVVQTNPLYTERELEYQLKDSGATFIVALDLLQSRVESVRANTELQHVIITSIKDYLPFPKSLIYPFVQRKQYGKFFRIETNETTHAFVECLQNQSSEKPILKWDIENDLALLQYTGGTTGFPKGVMLTHTNLVANTSMGIHWFYKCKPFQEKILAVLPFFHVYGMTTIMNLAIMAGYKMILLPRFDVEATLKAIQKYRPTLFPGAPTMYIALLNHPDLEKYDLSSIKACISGSAPLPLEVQEKFELLTGGRIVEGYGLTESSPVTHANFIWDKRINGSVGVPWPETEVGVISLETGERADVRQIGEIIVKGPQIMKGYWNRPEETEATLKDGWLFTGDLGYMDEEGFFYIVDRKKDMIIAGGFNIYPREIEEILYEHEAIAETVVAGVPDPYRGETVKAYIVLKEGKNATEEELNEFARKYLASYKVPRIYEFRKELPKTAVGKILRRTLVEEERNKQQQVK